MNASQVRTIKFPEDRSIGTLYLGDEVALFKAWGNPKGPGPHPAKSAEARGEIAIEGEDKALLIVSPDAPSLDALDDLAANALWGVRDDRCRTTDEDIASIAHVTSLECLSLCLRDATHAGAERIGNLTNLKSLALTFEVALLKDRWGYRLTSGELSFLKRLARLEQVWLYNELIDDGAIAHLCGLSNLRLLFLRNSTMTNAGLAIVAGFSGLESLTLVFTLGWSRFTDDGLYHLGRLKGLKHLGLWETNTTDAGVQHLSGLVGLESLALAGASRMPITDAGIVHLQGMCNLRRLVLDGAGVTDVGLVQVGRLTALEELDLTWSGLNDEGAARLREQSNLKRLRLSHTKITDAGLVHVGCLGSLEELELDSTAVTDSGLSHLKGLMKLRKLTLRETKVTKAGLEVLSGLASLEWPIPSGTG